MIIKGAAWYVYAFCRLRKEMRLFKLTRMMTVQLVLKFAPWARGRITDYYTPDRLQDMPDGSIMGFFPFPEDEWVY